MARSTDAKGLVERSIRAYAHAHREYEGRHGEIFNSIEQARLRSMLSRAAEERTASTRRAPPALDLGCGTGNLTQHLVELGFAVVAADVSPEFLAVIEARYVGCAQVSTRQLDGQSLDGLADDSFDLVGLYSVLHHIPDYLSIIAECVRVLRPGGVLVLDHEHNEHHWTPTRELLQFRAALKQHLKARSGRWNPAVYRWQRALLPVTYLNRLRLMRNPNHFRDREGDIHTRPDDHIEWEEIKRCVEDAGLEVVTRQDYLLCRADYPRELYEAWSGRCSDTTGMICRKR
jgi:SAM-dependent methyltransferase